MKKKARQLHMDCAVICSFSLNRQSTHVFDYFKQGLIKTKNLWLGYQLNYGDNFDVISKILRGRTSLVISQFLIFEWFLSLRHL